MAFKIITDTTANLSLSQLKTNNVLAIPFPFFIEGKENYCEDIENFDDKSYYKNIAEGVKVTTSQINPETYIKYFEEFLKNGQDILFIGLSSGISGSFGSATIAKQELLETFPNRKIYLIDSLGAGLGEALLVLKAVELQNNKNDIDVVFNEICQLRSRLYQVFFVDDLKHLHRTGRLSGVGAVVGSVLGVKPLLKGSTEGKIIPCGKERGRKKTILALAEKYRTLAKNFDRIAVSYADCKEDAQLLVSILNKIKPPKEIILQKHEPVTGSHLGPGALALFFEGDNTVREY